MRGHARPQLDVGSPACYIGRDGDTAGLSSKSNDVGLRLILLGVQQRVLNSTGIEHCADFLRRCDGPGPNQNRPLFVDDEPTNHFCNFAPFLRLCQTDTGASVRPL